MADMNVNIKSIIKIKRGTAAQWASSNPVLEEGELGLDNTNNILKVGNGSSNWSTLPTLNSQDIPITDLRGL